MKKFLSNLFLITLLTGSYGYAAQDFDFENFDFNDEYSCVVDNDGIITKSVKWAVNNKEAVAAAAFAGCFVAGASPVALGAAALGVAQANAALLLPVAMSVVPKVCSKGLVGVAQEVDGKIQDAGNVVKDSYELGGMKGIRKLAASPFKFAGKVCEENPRVCVMIVDRLFQYSYGCSLESFVYAGGSVEKAKEMIMQAAKNAPTSLISQIDNELSLTFNLNPLNWGFNPINWSFVRWAFKYKTMSFCVDKALSYTGLSNVVDASEIVTSYDAMGILTNPVKTLLAPVTKRAGRALSWIGNWIEG